MGLSQSGTRRHLAILRSEHVVVGGGTGSGVLLAREPDVMGSGHSQQVSAAATAARPNSRLRPYYKGRTPLRPLRNHVATVKFRSRHERMLGLSPGLGHRLGKSPRGLEALEGEHNQASRMRPRSRASSRARGRKPTRERAERVRAPGAASPGVSEGQARSERAVGRGASQLAACAAGQASRRSLRGKAFLGGELPLEPSASLTRSAARTDADRILVHLDLFRSARRGQIMKGSALHGVMKEYMNAPVSALSVSA